jgi:hypothetical protein
MESLQNEIDVAARTVRTDHYDLSIGEIANMYEANEIQSQFPAAVQMGDRPKVATYRVDSSEHPSSVHLCV